MPSDPTDSQTFVALDFETTGLDPKEDRIVEVGAIRFNLGGHLLGVFTSLIKADRSSSKQAAAIHQIPEAELAGAPVEAGVIADLMEFLGGAGPTVIVAHNAGFDRAFLEATLRRLRILLPWIGGNAWICTKERAKSRWPGLPSYRLEALADRFGLDPGNVHRALADADRCRLLFLLSERGEGAGTTSAAFPVLASADFPGIGKNEGVEPTEDRLGAKADPSPVDPGSDASPSLCSSPIIAVDFDGTCVDHRYPDLGGDVPGAEVWLKRFVRSGARLILWTMRFPESNDGPRPFADAVKWFADREIPLFGINENPEQTWSCSPKAYANHYIDDAAIGCPLRPSFRSGGRPLVDWEVVGPLVMRSLEPKQGSAP